MKSRIQEFALKLGFDQCRITTPEPADHATHFKAWLESSYQGEMEYLRRNAHKRLDPQQVLPGVKSIIVLAVSYERKPSSAEVENPSPQKGVFPGRIAKYSQYSDYHHVIASRLKNLSEFVTQLGGEKTRCLWYVDTGPVLERGMAQRAGMGFIGKHTNLISRSLGNWFFICEILTTLDLPPDTPMENHCGHCTRCLSSCPTNAIRAPFQLDARRCISYLTIELKGSIPLEFRPLIGNRIYGCDDCLAVCPWNRFARSGRLMAGHSRRDMEHPDLLELLSLDEPGFKRRFAETPILRTKFRGLMRNVCVALGNVGDRSALPHLEKSKNGGDPLIAEHAVWAIEEIVSKQEKGLNDLR